MKWLDALWAELEEMTPEQRVIASGEFIIELNRSVLSGLARYRRLAVADILDREEWDQYMLAETIGSTPSAVKRLAEEGRAIRKREAHQ